MATDFVHLHVHSDFSLLDGACHIHWSKLKPEEKAGKYDIVSVAQQMGMQAVALTDHGVMGGCFEFSQALSACGINPILGVETYVSPTSLTDHRPDIPNIKGYHLILLAQNFEGYQNLCRLVSQAHGPGFYYKPRIDKEFLAAHCKGLIGLSACLQGEIAYKAVHSGEKEARNALGEYVDIFGKENFFLEIMDHGIPEQKTVIRTFNALSRESGIPLVATNDVHYLIKEHARPHDLMLCIQTHAMVTDERRMRMSGPEYYFKSPEEMKEIFRELPQAVTNTVGIAERCHVELDMQTNHYPVYRVKEGETQAEILRNLCIKGFPGRYGYDLLHPDEAHRENARMMMERMDYELGIIHKTKYDSYFLVVWDFINAAKSIGVPVGPGRGSGAGSLVAYLVGITDIDPIRFHLFFERFLNPDRVSPPDFDIDFCERRRGEVIQYVTEKYGADCVCQIGTYGTLKAKNAIKDVARVLGKTPAEGDKITKCIPNDPKMTIAKALQTDEMKEFLSHEPWAKEVIDEALPLEGLNRNMGIHAAGVIICDHPLAPVVPLGRGANAEVVTQYQAAQCEAVKLLKMDFLGLRTLTVIADAVENVYKSRGIRIDLDTLPLDDKPTYDLLNSGNTIAVFQLESGGMQNLCRQFKVETIEHICALLAIYRPGPMDYIPEFVGRKVSGRKIEYDHPLMEPILNETYGIMLYQEQIMQVVQALAGFSLGQADILRRAIGKKKEKEMAAQHIKFVEGCAKTNNISEELANQIWEKINKFAGYGFNKSHSAAYAVVSYRTAYLKAHYRPEFYAAVLSSELGKSDKLMFLINACHEEGIKVLPPDVNHSEISFSVDGGNIRFGLGAIKGFGEGAAQAIIDARSQGGEFKSLSDLLERTSGLNAKNTENLIRAGAMDSFGLKRSQLVEIIEPSLACAASRRRDKELGQGNLFEAFGMGEEEDFSSVPVPDIPEFDETEILNQEKALLGFYVSGHPAEKYAPYLAAFSSHNVAGIFGEPKEIGVKVGGVFKSVTKKTSKKDGSLFAVIQFEDPTGTIECMAYPKTYESCKDVIHADERNKAEAAAKGLPVPAVVPVVIKGVTRRNDENAPPVLIAEKIQFLDQTLAESARELIVHVNDTPEERELLARLKELVLKNPGETKFVLCIHAGDRAVFLESKETYRVRVSRALTESINELFGGEFRCRFKAEVDVPQPKVRFVPRQEETREREEVES
ncbi:MAG: DNA polymerase III subunit alpha [Lentisphaeria bacterium]|nr:DNA polymerase III subunit alpha [Lentisphaeria bacterium]